MQLEQLARDLQYVLEGRRENIIVKKDFKLLGSGVDITNMELEHGTRARSFDTNMQILGRNKAIRYAQSQARILAHGNVRLFGSTVERDVYYVATGAHEDPKGAWRFLHFINNEGGYEG